VHICLAVGERLPPWYFLEEETLAFNRSENLQNPDSAGLIAWHRNQGWRPAPLVGPHHSHRPTTTITISQYPRCSHNQSSYLDNEIKKLLENALDGWIFFLDNARGLCTILLRREKTKSAQGNGKAKESPSQTHLTHLTTNRRVKLRYTT
jgi:hypothetical protein